MTGPAVQLRDVFCVHRSNEGDAAALQGANLELADREVLGVLGPSGAGKSTLLRVIAGIQTPSAGIVNVLGWDVGRMPSRARARFRHERLGFLGQHADQALAPDLPARELVALGLALRGVPRRARRARAAELLEAVGLRDRADAFAAELSGGERQRIVLCAAIAHRPALLLADEPTGELDRGGAEVVRTLIATLARAYGTSVIVVSHDPETVGVADRSVAIRDGRVVEEHRHGESALVVGRDGWLRLPNELRGQAGISDRVRVRPGPGGLMVVPAGVADDPSPSSALGPDGVVTPPDWSPARVALSALTRGYGRGERRRPVIAELTRVFEPGCLTAVTGPSGRGKTTLLRLLAGLDRADSGRLTIDDEPLGERDDEQLAALRRRRIGYLPQEAAPVGFLSARENVVLALRIRGCDAATATERANAALNQVGLAGRAGQRVHRLSAGEAQRVALARALASARGLLIVDEPTSRLDEHNAGIVAGLLATAAAAHGQTVICATHDPAVIGRAQQLLSL